MGPPNPLECDKVNMGEPFIVFFPHAVSRRPGIIREEESEGSRREGAHRPHLPALVKRYPVVRGIVLEIVLLHGTVQYYTIFMSLVYVSCQSFGPAGNLSFVRVGKVFILRDF